MSDALIREVMKRIVAMDYKLACLISIMSQAIPKLEGQTLKELLDRRTDEFVGPKCTAVTDQVLAEIRETIAKHSAHKSSHE
jgi:hypothetical protein